ncbi:hypothetical protein KQI84_01355 [bacterium]|nr:hypothetical protein [bacterium]
MKRAGLLILILIFPLIASAGGLLPVAVDDFTSGTNAGFGGAYFPGNVLTGPHGGDLPPNVPNDSAEDLLSLGDGGSIVLAWPADNVIVNGPDEDFTVFENVLVNNGDSVPFIETATVEVSQDGISWTLFPFNFLPPDGFDSGDPFAIPLLAENYEGLAGTQPTLVTNSNGIDPGDPSVSGGDAFDLADVGLGWARYVRLTDTGTPGASSEMSGTNGEPIYDSGLTLAGPPTAGFDLDTIVAVNYGAPSAASVSDWSLY